MKKKGFTILNCLLVLLMAVTLTACKGDDGSASDPNLGTYEGQSAEMSGFTVGVDQLFEEGISVELKKKGKGKIRCDGATDSLKWTLDGDKFHAEGGGNEYDGTVSEGVMVLEDILGTGMSVTLVNGDYTASSEDNKDTGDYGSGESKLGKSGSENNDRESDDSESFSGSKEEAFKAAKTGSGSSSDDKGSDEGAGSFTEMMGASDDAGEWELFVVVQNGHSYMKEDLEKKGIHSTISMREDGTGQIDLVGRLMDMEWSNGQIVVPDNGEGKREEYRYSISNEYLVLVDEDMVFTFMRKE
ncbi:MAG: hypothetical protein K6E63_03595 [Lachnospiraceae bacterium]|nr:hypothetical protein [Lachnospiraceae bacterium]